MKKFTLLLMSLLMVTSLAFAQKKLCVHKLDGTKLEVLASEVSYIDFEDVTTNPDDDPVVPGSGSFVAKPFSVSATKTVTFSPGNLQYHAVNDEWRFAPSQTDYIGYVNENISSTYNGWIDLFGWGTGNNPTNASTDYNDYKTFVDWGVNKIGNDAPNTWRTLTYDEWEYLRYGRPNYDKLIGVAQVNGVNGLILLPDGWTCPSGVTFKSGFHEDYAAYQTFSALDWSKLEASGAVFLPAAGCRYGSDVSRVQNFGYYWSATESYSDDALNLYFDSAGAHMLNYSRYDGQSVRLVQDDAEADKPITYTISFDANGGSGDMQSSELEENTTFTIPSNTFTHEGYEFTGWNTKSDGTGTLYAVGAEINITSDITLYAQWKEKIYDGSFVAKPFSVSATKTVTFSPGNLQYHAANDKWRFAPNQTDYIGYDNKNISSTYNGWIDLFGWGTGDNPTNKSTDNYDYQTFVDWGVNKIGSYSPNTWRTLTYDEWYYLRYQRPNYDKLIGIAEVNGVNGLILLPDAWVCPSGVTFKAGFHNDWCIGCYGNYQTISALEWSKLEASGAVFLPAAGDRDGSDVDTMRYYGRYWSASEYNSDFAYDLDLDSDGAYMGSSYRYQGLSVRLVQDDAEADKPITYTISFDANGGSGDMQSSELEENTTFTIPSNTFTHEGYEFTGWNTKADGTGTLYAVGAEINITSDITLYAQWEEKIYDGGFVAKPFSVSATKTVTFSPGNLQYHPANDEWRFAPNQTDYIGADNENIGSTYNGWIDLFGWGTGDNPTNKSTDYNDYQTFVDWGVNKIGSYSPNTWRTLTYDEWYYLRYKRPNYDKLIGVAEVNGVNGLILLPDAWVCPSGVTFKAGFDNNWCTPCYGHYQTISALDWSKLEASGAVFLPAAGVRDGSGVYYVQRLGGYWSATEYDSYGAYDLSFSSLAADMGAGDRYSGPSVRLVQD